MLLIVLVPAIDRLLLRLHQSLSFEVVLGDEEGLHVSALEERCHSRRRLDQCLAEAAREALREAHSWRD